MGQQSLPKKPNTFKEIKEDIQINEDVEDDDDLDVGLLSPEGKFALLVAVDFFVLNAII